MNIRRFLLFRSEDATGVSGTGVVAEGVELSDGRCVLHWTGEVGSIGIYASRDELLAIHGHEGRTVITWVDQ